MRSLVLGVDGGNTKSLALVADLDGRVVGTGRAGCGDIYASTVEPALAELDVAVGCALREADASPDEIVAAGFSLAGADWPEDHAFLEAEMGRRLGPSTRIVVVNDALGALRGGTPAGEGVAVVAGTGSAIGARRHERTWHASFWGEDGGALTIGHAALRAMVRAELALDPPVQFNDAALAALGASSVEDLLHHATRRRATRTMLASLAPVILDAADDGDPIALRIVLAAGQRLAEYAGVAARTVGLGDDPYPLVLAGGVFRHPSPLIRTEIIASLPGARVIDAAFEPVAGALLLGFDALGRRADLDLLRRTLPAHDRFATAG
jgi:N-acetylglucosamine kinase-like BadF-type ATPase